MIYLMVAVFIIELVVLKYINKSCGSCYSYIMGPYAFVILLNNSVAVNYGFYKILDSVVLITIVGMSCFALGIIVIYMINAKYHLKIKKTYKNGNVLFISREMVLSEKQWNKILLYCIVVTGLIVAKYVGSFRLGVTSLFKDDMKNMQVEGLLGHLQLATWSMAPLLLYKWANEKKEKILSCVYIYYSIKFFVVYKISYNSSAFVYIFFLYITG